MTSLSIDCVEKKFFRISQRVVDKWVFHLFNVWLGIIELTYNIHTNVHYSLLQILLIKMLKYIITYFMKYRLLANILFYSTDFMTEEKLSNLAF